MYFCPSCCCLVCLELGLIVASSVHVLHPTKIFVSPSHTFLGLVVSRRCVFSGGISKDTEPGSCFVLFLFSLCFLGHILLSLPVPREGDAHIVTVASGNILWRLRDQALEQGLSVERQVPEERVRQLLEAGGHAVRRRGHPNISPTEDG